MAHTLNLASALIDFALCIVLVVNERHRARERGRPVRRALVIVLGVMGVAALVLVALSFVLD